MLLPSLLLQSCTNLLQFSFAAHILEWLLIYEWLMLRSPLSFLHVKAMNVMLRIIATDGIHFVEVVSSQLLFHGVYIRPSSTPIFSHYDQQV